MKPLHLLVSGYYGFDNAGDEAVLAALLQEVAPRLPSGSRITITSGNPELTREIHGAAGSAHGVEVEAIPRGHPIHILRALRACDGLISGGGSLLQDVTSLRNVMYYCGLMRAARIMRRPLMIYAQGIGPLRRRVTRRIAARALNGASLITLRDAASAELLRGIGVRRPLEVTADPVWSLAPPPTPLEREKGAPRWILALRPWPGDREGEFDWEGPLIALRAAAAEHGASLSFAALQPSSDLPLCRKLARPEDEIISCPGRHPRDLMGLIGQGSLLIGMRLHALIFAAAQGVPCLALDYDPKVRALAHATGMPLLAGWSQGALQNLPELIRAARPLSPEARSEAAGQARCTAELAEKWWGNFGL